MAWHLKVNQVIKNSTYFCSVFPFLDHANLSKAQVVLILS